MVRRRRNQADARDGVTHARDYLVHFMPGQLAALCPRTLPRGMIHLAAIARRLGIAEDTVRKWRAASRPEAA